ncbi:MAG: ethanolamine ammonia lyase-activating protein, partial [Dehalococcoidia bacterium]|nr:ethanolamine ammonia lyase-activating protein [Dehalococcoidia bacterium]
KPGSVFSPPESWFHQHFNTGRGTVRQLALRRGIDGIGTRWEVALDMKKGGDQLEYEDEDPAIRRLYEEELARRGLKSGMG